MWVETLLELVIVSFLIVVVLALVANLVLRD